MYWLDPDRIYFACVAPNGEVLTEPAIIPGEYNNSSAQAVWDIYALGRDRIFLLRVDAPDEGNPFIIYEQNICREGGVLAHTPVLTTVFQSTSIIRAKQVVDGKLFFSGTTLHPDSLPLRKEWSYCVSMDTSGVIVDSVDYFQKRRSFTGTIGSFLNMPDRVSAFYYQAVAHQEDAGNEYIAMIQKVDTSLAVGWEPGAGLHPNHIWISEFPSPFNASTTFTFSLPHKASIELGIYDLHGRLITKLAHGIAEAGEHSGVWNAPGAGVYFAVLEVKGEGKAVRKVVCVK